MKNRYWMVAIFLLILLGNYTQACELYQPDVKTKVNVTTVEKVEDAEDSPKIIDNNLIITRWLNILDKLIERFPIIEKILQVIFRWINSQLDS